MKKIAVTYNNPETKAKPKPLVVKQSKEHPEEYDVVSGSIPRRVLKEHCVPVPVGLGLRTFTCVVGGSLFLFRRKSFSDAVAFVQAHFSGTPDLKLEEVATITIMNLKGKGQVNCFADLDGEDFDIDG